MISNTDMKYMCLAAEQSQLSPMLMRHGCVAVTSGKIIGRGFNNYRSFSKDGFMNNVCTCHAEIACLRTVFNKYTTNEKGKTCKNIKVVYG
jgi:tRNA(Arg) A34 adenosine deaminase TadA